MSAAPPAGSSGAAGAGAAGAGTVPDSPAGNVAGAVAGARGPLLAWRTLPFPTDWDAEFGFGGPLELEIGFGDGRFTVRRALSAPATRFVGLEVSSTSLQRALKGLRRAGVSNVRLAKVGAEFAVRQLFAPGSLDAMLVNFPDPWPKGKHERHRLLKRPFFELAASRLRAGGEIRLATDHRAYLEFALAEAQASGLFEATFPDPPEAVFETKYALKWRERGIPLNYVVFRRTSAPPPAPAQFSPLERPAEMPHSLLSGRLPRAASLAKTVITYGGGHVVLHEAADVMPAAQAAPSTEASESAAGRLGQEGRSADGGRTAPNERGERWLVRVTVEEPDLKQQLLVVVQQRKPDEVIVRLESFGDPIITAAVRGAVHAVTDWLEKDTDLSVKQRNY